MDMKTEICKMDNKTNENDVLIRTYFHIKGLGECYNFFLERDGTPIDNSRSYVEIGLKSGQYMYFEN